MRYWFLFHEGKIILRKHADGQWAVPSDEELPTIEKRIEMPFAPMDGTDCMAAELSHWDDADASFMAIGLRASYDVLPLSTYLHAGKAAELLNWNERTQHCGYCGGEMEMSSLISKRCKACGREVWPRLSPAVIVLIRRGREVLLVQSLTFKGDYYGLVAGFVETGESLEDCVYREVMEETQMEITNLRYFGSQPWPYPCGLMAGFTADWKSGELHLQKEELRKGGWFDRDHLPVIPGKLSMARKLIDSWIGDNCPA